MKFIPIFYFLLFLNCCAADEASWKIEQLNKYCHFYLIELAKIHNPTSTTDETVIVNEVYKDNSISGHLSNLFQWLSPPDQRIDSAYWCNFKIQIGGEHLPGEILMLLIENKDFAEFSIENWNLKQESPVELLDSNGKLIYYISLKYLKINDQAMWVNKNLDKLLSQPKN